jgi:hypothetical protein
MQIAARNHFNVQSKRARRPTSKCAGRTLGGRKSENPDRSKSGPLAKSMRRRRRGNRVWWSAVGRQRGGGEVSVDEKLPFCGLRRIPPRELTMIDVPAECLRA